MSPFRDNLKRVLDMISYILTGERSPKVEVVEKLAAALGLQGWHLLMPRKLWAERWR